MAGSIDRDELGANGGNFRETSGLVQLSWRAGRKLAVSLQSERFERHADTSATDYTENRAWLQLTYGAAPAGLPESATRLPVGPEP